MFPTPEDAPFPVQTSLYGASKLAGEGLIAAYCEGFGFQGCIFRFVSILGERYTHGHVFDFYKKPARAIPTRLRVLGNGKQRKSYLYVQDCIDAMLTRDRRRRGAQVNVFNLGTDEYCEVNDSIGWICEHLGVTPALDVHRRRARLDRRQPVHLPRHRERIRALGWKPRLTIREGVIRTLDYLRQHRGLLDERRVMADAAACHVCGAPTALVGDRTSAFQRAGLPCRQCPVCWFSFVAIRGPTTTSISGERSARDGRRSDRRLRGSSSEAQRQPCGGTNGVA